MALPRATQPGERAFGLPGLETRWAQRRGQWHPQGMKAADSRSWQGLPGPGAGGRRRASGQRQPAGYRNHRPRTCLCQKGGCRVPGRARPLPAWPGCPRAMGCARTPQSVAAKPGRGRPQSRRAGERRTRARRQSAERAEGYRHELRPGRRPGRCSGAGRHCPGRPSTARWGRDGSGSVPWPGSARSAGRWPGRPGHSSAACARTG